MSLDPSDEHATMQSQAEIVAFLREPETHDVQAVEVIETHVAQVFLVGGLAYKLKRAVKFPFLDFSTAADRKVACENDYQEYRLAG